MENTVGNITYEVDDNYLASRKGFSNFLTEYKEELEKDNWQIILTATTAKTIYTILHLGHIDPLEYIKGALPYASFTNCPFITSVNIPNSITTLGEFCFSGCSSLKSATLPNSVKSLGDYCFSGCIALKSITLPDSVTSLERRCFSDCSSLESITLPNSITTLGEYCFAGCIALKSIILPNSVTSLGDYCFRGCTSLKTLTCSKNLKFDREKIGLADNVQIIRR